MTSEETRRKIAIANTGRKLSEKSRKKMSESIKKLYANGWQNPRKGKHLSAETKRKMSLSKKGKPAWNKGKTGIYTEETKKKMRINKIISSFFGLFSLFKRGE